MTAADDVRAAVSAAVAGTHGAIVGWRGPARRPWSWQFRAETVGARSGRLLVKVPRWEGVGTLEAALVAGPQAASAGEFSALGEIYAEVRASGDPGLTAVVPVAYVAAVNALVMEDLDAVSLRLRLGAGRGPAEAVEWFAGIGRWLGRYHRRPGRAIPARFSAVAEVTRWEEAGLGHPGLRRSLALARAAAESLDGRTVMHGVQHGDLTLGNVLVTREGKVAVIDPNGTTGRWEADAARLLAEIRLGRGQLLTLGAMRPGSLVDRWARALAQGHGGLDAGVLAYDRGAEALQRRIALGEGGAVSRLTAAVTASLFRGEIRRRFAA